MTRETAERDASSPGYQILAIIGGFVLAGGLVVGIINARRSVEADLRHYFPIRAALASDRLDGIEDHAGALGKSDDPAVAQAAHAIAKAPDIAAARTAFGELSKALAAEAAGALRAGEKLPSVLAFECPIAKPYGRWVQEPATEIGNPYLGAQKASCGKAVPWPAGAGGGPCKHGCCGGGKSTGTSTSTHSTRRTP